MSVLIRFNLLLETATYQLLIGHSRRSRTCRPPEQNPMLSIFRRSAFSFFVSQFAVASGSNTFTVVADRINFARCLKSYLDRKLRRLTVSTGAKIDLGTIEANGFDPNPYLAFGRLRC